MGEIALVVIGILIALSINKRSENLQNRESEAYYLNELSNVYSSNLEALNQVSKLNLNNVQNAFAILEQISPDQPKISAAHFDSLLVNTIASDVVFKPNYEVISELNNSGKLNLFTNAKIRTALVLWPELVQSIKTQESEIARLRLQLTDYFLKNGSVRYAVYQSNGFMDIPASKFKNRNMDLLASEEFDNIIIAFIGASLWVDQMYIDISDQITGVLKLINEENDPIEL